MHLYPFVSQSDKAHLVEVDGMLRTILEIEQNNSRKDSAQIALVALCLAMLWFLGRDDLQVSHLTKLQSLTH